MKENDLTAFGQEQALAYDKRNAKLSAISESLYLKTRIILSELSADARILCIGAGTGTEIMYLAKAFPNWYFTALDPSESILNACRQKAEEHGIADRYIFHHGNTSAPEYKQLMLVWKRLLQLADWTPESIESIPRVYKEKVGLLPPKDVEVIVEKRGFSKPILFYKNLFIHAWFSNKQMLS